mgnify:CR=1 FL=1
MPDIQILIDERQLQRIEQVLKPFPRALPKVASRAVNKAAASARADAVRQLTRHLNLKQKRIRRDIHVKKASYSNWAATVSVRGQTIPLREFATSRPTAQGQGFRRPRRGIAYIIERAKGKTTHQRMFFAQMYSGHIGVFARGGREQRPIHEQFGPSVGGAYEQAGRLVQEATIYAYRNLEKYLDTQVKLLLEKVGGAA